MEKVQSKDKREAENIMDNKVRIGILAVGGVVVVALIIYLIFFRNKVSQGDVITGKDGNLYTVGASEDILIDFSIPSDGSEDAVIPEQFTTIGQGAFEGVAIKSVALTNVTEIGERAFSDCTFLSLADLGSVRNIGNEAFYNCTGLGEISIPASVASIGNRAFDGASSLTSIDVAPGNTLYSSAEGVLYNNNQSILIKVPEGLTELTIPDTVTTVQAGAFNNSGVKEPTFEDNIETIGEQENWMPDVIHGGTLGSAAEAWAIEKGVLYSPAGGGVSMDTQLPDSTPAAEENEAGENEEDAALETADEAGEDENTETDAEEGTDAATEPETVIPEHTVAFDMSGQAGAITSQVISEGGTLKEPETPSAEGYVFGGWYANKECTTAWDFAVDTVRDDITLYAKWEPASSSGENGSVHAYTVAANNAENDSNANVVTNSDAATTDTTAAAGSDAGKDVTPRTADNRIDPRFILVFVFMLSGVGLIVYSKFAKMNYMSGNRENR